MSKMWNSHIHFHLLSYLFVGSKYYKEHRITATKYIHSNQPSLPLPTNTNSAVLLFPYECCTQTGIPVGSSHKENKLPVGCMQMITLENIDRIYI